MTVHNVSTSQAKGMRIHPPIIRPLLTHPSDGNIRYFEYQNDKFEFLSEHKSSEPQRGIAFLPKRGVNTHENEVMRAFKTVNDTYIEPISFIVPRRAEVFQDDIYPPVVGLKPAMSSHDWFAGKEALPPKIDLASIYAGEEPAEVPSDYKPQSQTEPGPPPNPTPQAAEPTPDPVPSALRGPPPSMTHQTASIKDLASKFNDDDDSSAAEEEDTSSFEEVANPTSRPHPPTISPEKPSPPTTASRSLGDALSPTKPHPDDLTQASQTAAGTSTKTLIETQGAPLGDMKTEPLAEQLPASTSIGAVQTQEMGGGGGEEGEVKQSLAEIKSLLEVQARSMRSQSETIGRLTQEVEWLRERIGE